MDKDSEVNNIKLEDIDRLTKFLSLAKQDLSNGVPISPDKFYELDG